MASELDTAFLKEILKRGLVTEYQVDQARKTFQTLEKQGTAGSVPQVFIQLRFLKPDQVHSILGELKSSSEPSLSVPSLSEPSLSVPSLSEPSLSEPSLSEPSLSEPSLSEPALSEPSLSEPSLTEPALAEPSLSDPSLADPAPQPVAVPPSVPPVPTPPPESDAQPVSPLADLSLQLEGALPIKEGASPVETERFSAAQSPAQVLRRTTETNVVPIKFSRKKIIAVKIAKAVVPFVVLAVLSYGIYFVVVAGNAEPKITPPQRKSQASTSVPTVPTPEPEKKEKPEPAAPKELSYFEFENRFLTHMDKSDFMGALKYLNEAPDSVTNSAEPGKLESLRQRVISKARERFKNKQSQIREYVAADEYAKALEIIKPLQKLDIPEINTLVGAQIEELEAGMNRAMALNRALAFQDIWIRIKQDWMEHEYNLVTNTISGQLNQPKVKPIAGLLTDSIDEIKRGEKFMGSIVTKLAETSGRSIRAFGRVVKVVSVTRQTVSLKVGLKSGSRPLGKLEPENLVTLFKDDELTDHQKYGLAIYAYAAGESKLGEEWLAELPEDYEGPEVLRAFVRLTRDTEAVTYLNRLQMAARQFKSSKIRLNGRKLLSDFKDTDLVKAYEPWIKEKLQLKK